MADPQAYTTDHEEQYIDYLGLWSYPSPPNYTDRRNEEIYVQLLKDYLFVNCKRTDKLGKHGCQYARVVLEKLTNGKRKI